MSTPENLMALGTPPFPANRIGQAVQFISAEGSTAGDAKQLPGFRQAVFVVNAGTSGVKMPGVGGDGAANGLNLTDELTLVNLSGAAIVVFAANNARGSAVTLVGGAGATAGTTGVSLGSNLIGWFKAVTISTFIFMRPPISA